MSTQYLPLSDASKTALVYSQIIDIRFRMTFPGTGIVKADIFVDGVCELLRSSVYVTRWNEKHIVLRLFSPEVENAKGILKMSFSNFSKFNLKSHK